MSVRMPNLELLAYKAWIKLVSNSKYDKRMKKIYHNYDESKLLQPDLRVDCFVQTWGSTCLGFDIDEHGTPLCGGSAMTDAYTTVVHEKQTDMYVIFFGDKACYLVENPIEQFYEDLKNRNLARLSEALKRY